MLLRFTYLAISRAFATLRLLLLSDHEKDIEILALRHQWVFRSASSLASAHNGDPRTERSWQRYSRRWPARRCAGCAC